MDFTEYRQVNMPSTPENCPVCDRPTTASMPFCICNFDLRYGSANRSKGGICIYCPEKGRILLSEEHIFGKWLTRRFPKSPTATTTHILTRPEKIEWGVKTMMHERSAERPGHQYHTKVRNVCRECNNVWMSRLHTEAQELVVRLAGGEWPELSKDEQLILARWVTMVAINLESYSRQTVTSQNQRAALKRGEMPSGWRIALCRMRGRHDAGYSHLRKKVLDVRYGDEHAVAQSVFFCIEGVAFHALSALGNIPLFIGLREAHNEPVFSHRRLWPTLEPRRIGRRIYCTVEDIEEAQDRLIRR